MYSRSKKEATTSGGGHPGGAGDEYARKVSQNLVLMRSTHDSEEITSYGGSQMKSGIVLAGLVAAVTIAGCGSQLTGPPRDIDAAVEAWGGMEMTEYRFSFERQCFCVREAVEPVMVYVTDDEVVRVVSLAGGNEMDLSGPASWPTMNEILDEVARARADGNLTAITYGDQGLPVHVEIGSLAADAGVIYDIGTVYPVMIN